MRAERDPSRADAKTDMFVFAWSLQVAGLLQIGVRCTMEAKRELLGDHMRIDTHTLVRAASCELYVRTHH